MKFVVFVALSVGLLFFSPCNAKGNNNNTATKNLINNFGTTFSLKKLHTEKGKENELKFTEEPDDEKNILNKIIKLLTQTIGTFAIFMMIVAGYYFLTSAGDEGRLQKGKNIFLFTIGGLVVAFLSVIIVQLVISIIFNANS